MSEQQRDELDVRIQQLNSVARAGWGVITFFIVTVFGFGGWVATLEYRQSRTAADIAAHTASLSAHTESLNAGALWRAEANANRFTTADYNRNSALLQEQLLNHDKRLTRTEDTLGRLEASMLRLETKLGTRP